jgi:general secretion pathway protein D
MGWAVPRAYLMLRMAFGACTLFVTSCSLPYEQLTFPNSISSSRGHAPTSENPSKKGVALADSSPAETRQPRVFDGSGMFVSDTPAKPVPAASASAPSGSKVPKDAITINLVGASVSEVAKTVLDDVLGVNYSVSEKVKASITLSTVRPVDKDGLLEIFEAVLRAEGAALVVEGGLYKIIPSTDAAASGAPPRMRQTSSNRQGLSTIIVPLKFVSPVEMERILKSASPQASVLRVDTARNLLVISGTQTEISSMNELVDVFDVDWMRGMSFAIFPVETSDPEAIAQELDTIFANDQDSPTKGVVRFIPNKRLKSILVITSRPTYLKKAAAWLARIDLTSRATEKQVFVYRVQHRPASELAGLMQKVYGGKGGGQRQSSLIDTSRSSPDGPASGTPFAAPSIQAPTQPGFNSTPQRDSSQTGSAGDAAPVAATSDTSRAGSAGSAPPDDRATGISIVADEPNNSLVITATSAEYHRMRQMLQSVDLSPRQVMIEATIAEVTLTNDLKFGVRSFLNQGATRDNPQHGNNFTFSDLTSGALASSLPGFSYFMNFSNMKIVLDAINSVTDVNVLSTPSLTVMENKKAILQVGDEVPITTGTAVSTGAANAPIVNSVSFRSTGVILGITPRVSDGGRVVLDIEQEVSSVIPTTSSNIDSPTIQQRRIKTTVTVNDGESILLAGLVQDNSSRARDQVHILGDFPLIGNAFKSKTDKIHRTELLIAITPYVIRDSRQIDQIAAEYRDKLNFSTRPQRARPPDTSEEIDRLIR